MPSLEEAVRSLERIDPPLTDEASAAAVQARIDCLEASITRFEREAINDSSTTEEQNEAAQAELLAAADRVCKDAKTLREGLKQTA